MRHDHYAREDERPGDWIDEIVEVLIVVGVAAFAIAALAWGPGIVEAALHRF